MSRGFGRWLVSLRGITDGRRSSSKGPVPYLYSIIHHNPLYQLAFFTPGRFPSSACSLKLYCATVSILLKTHPRLHPFPRPRRTRKTHPRHLEIPKDTPRLAPQDTPVPHLRPARVAVHLRELQLRLGPHARRQRRVPNNVPQRLPRTIPKETPRISEFAFLKGGRGKGGGAAHLSGSNCSKTLRFVWSRMMRVLMKQPRSSFFALNMDILAVWVLGRGGGWGLVRRFLWVTASRRKYFKGLDGVRRRSGVMTQQLFTCRARRVLAGADAEPG